MDHGNRNASSQPALESLEPRLLLAGTMAGQYFAWLVNRARHDPVAFQDEHDTIITVSLDKAPSMPPLAYNELLMDAASWKMADMVNLGYNADLDSLNRMPNQMVVDNGYNLSGQFGPHVANPDNDVESRSVGPTNADAALATMLQDDGKADADAIRRVRLLGLDTATNHDALVLREIGADGAAGCWVAETACQGGAMSFLTGVCYHDDDGDGRYDQGEGYWGPGPPTVEVVGVSWPRTVNNLGGTWSVQVPNSPSTYSVKVMGGFWVGTSNATVNVRGDSIEVDFINGLAAGIVNFGGGSLRRPAIPTAVIASDGAFTDKVHVTWWGVPTALSYNIYRNTTNNSATATYIGNTTALAFDDTNVVYGSTFYYWVAGVNRNGVGKFSTPDTGWFNSPPTLTGITADPTTVIQSGALTLTATDPQDIDGTVTKVQFYRDVNANGLYDTGDVSLGTGTFSGGNWVWNGRATGFPAGPVSVLAVPIDNMKLSGAAVAAAITVEADVTPPEVQFTSATIIDAPGATLTFDVTYTDNAAVDASDIDGKDIRVTGPGGYNKMASLVRVSSKTDDTPIVATYGIPGPGGNWDFADNGVYTVALLDNQVTDANGLLLPGNPALGTLTMDLFNAPDLAASFGTIVAPAPLVPGDKVTVPVIIRNVGGIPAKGKTDTNLILGKVGTIIDLGTKTSTISLNPGASATVSFTFTVPPQTLPGDYAFTATADVTGVIATDPRLANNVRASTIYTIVWQFGAVGLRKGVKMIVADADGTLVTFAMTGAGAGTLAGSALTITGTTATSSVTVTTVKSKTPGDDGKTVFSGVTVGDPLNPADRTPLGALTAKTSDLAGDFAITGNLATLALHDVSGVRTLSIGPAVKATDAATLTFNKVSDLALTSAMPIKSLTAVEWLAPTAGSNSITAPSLGALAIKGDAKQASTGDFGADITISGAGLKPTAKALSSASIAGSVAPSTWDVSGLVGAVTLRGAVGLAGQPWQLINAMALGPLTLGDVADAEVGVTGSAGAVKAIRWLDGSLTAGAVASISATGLAATKTAPAIPGDFGAAVTLTNALAKQSLARMTVAGTLDGAEVRTRSAIGTLTVGAIQNALIFAGVKDTVTGLPDPAADFDVTTSIGTVTVKGLKTAAPWTINSNIAAAKLGTITLAGIQFTNANPFGLAAHTLTRLKYKDGATTYSWPNTNPLEKTHPLPRDQFEVNLA
jgi:fibronectin type 3 domain-containing protein